MKKISLIIFVLSLLAFGGCENYNDKNFEGLDEMVTIKNVATYEADYTGKYPKVGYFSTKQELADSVYKWLIVNYYTCDSGSVAKIRLQYADSLEIPKNAAKSYKLIAEDYDSMGTEPGMPGKYDNFSASIDPLFYLPIFLKQKYPYATTEVKGITYAFYGDGQTKDSTSSFYYDGNVWTYLGDLPRIAVTEKIAEFIYDGKWKLNKILGGIEKYILVNQDYKALYDWVKANKSAYLSTTAPTTDEYYFGVATTYNNVNNNVNTWKSYYNIDNEYAGISDEGIRKIMHSRMSTGLATIVLPNLYTTPQSGINYQITYAVYGGLAANYTIVFMYDDTKKEFYKTEGPNF